MTRTNLLDWAAGAVAIASPMFLVGCGGTANSSSPSATASAPSASPSPSATAAPSASPSASPSPSSAPQPVLGGVTGTFSQGSGFGQVKPVEIDNGGDPTGRVGSITWTSWGGGQAIGSGQSDYVGPGQDVAGGTQETVTIVGFDLGTCGGKLMYRAVEWYFPQHGDKFNPNQYEDICTGNYVPSA